MNPTRSHPEPPSALNLLMESVYENALAIELNEREISFVRQAVVPLFYKGVAVGERRLDLLVEGTLVVELKAVEAILPVLEAQVLTYLRTTGRPLALLINFNVPLLRDGVRRLINSK